MPKLPNGLVICASSLLCAAVVGLQQAESYATRLEAQVEALSEFLLHLPEDLRAAGAFTLATELTGVEKAQLAALSALVSPESEGEVGSEVAESSEDEPPATEAAAEAEPAEAVAAAATEAAAEEPVADAPAPAAEPAAVAADAVAEVEAPTDEAAAPDEQAEPAAELPARETIPLVDSSWQGLLVRASLAPLVAPAEGQGTAFAAVKAAPAAAEPALAEHAPDSEPASAAEQGEQQAEPTAVAAAAPEAEEPALTQAPPMRYRIMMVGDSLMEDLGPRTHRALIRRKGLEFIVSAKFSTGLSRPDYFNWPAHMREVVDSRKPDLVVFFMGANDGMPIKEGRTAIPTGSDAWRAAYCRKMDEVVGIARAAGAEVIWVELPAVGGRYRKILHETQKAQREYCESQGLITLQSDDVLSGEWGKFAPFGTYKGKTVRLRRKDETHLTPDGNMKLIEALLPIIEERLIAFYRSHPERHLSEAELAGIKSVPAVYTCPYKAVSRGRARR